MTTTESKHVDRTGWGAGPWNSESDRYEFEAHGLPCLIVRGPSGALCGYAAVPPGHPAHGQSYESKWDENDNRLFCVLDDVSVHGGITYTEECQGRICHVAKPGEPDDVWWVGFDCAHSQDISPSRDANDRARGWEPLHWPRSAYRTVAYVRAETERLAEQLAGMGR